MSFLIKKINKDLYLGKGANGRLLWTAQLSLAIRTESEQVAHAHLRHYHDCQIIKITQGTKCLGYCGKRFKSPDPIRIRICPACKEKQGKVGGREVKFHGEPGVHYRSR